MIKKFKKLDYFESKYKNPVTWEQNPDYPEKFGKNRKLRLFRNKKNDYLGPPCTYKMSHRRYYLFFILNLRPFFLKWEMLLFDHL